MNFSLCQVISLHFVKNIIYFSFCKVYNRCIEGAWTCFFESYEKLVALQ
nr:MAG TPA: hypothetical protein [Caudoviricetes sp.]